jgi:hypothetical protein
MAERIDFGYLVPKLVGEDGTFDSANVSIIQDILDSNSYRRSDEVALRNWYRGTGAPINTRTPKKGDIEVTNKINNKIQQNYLRRLTRIRTGYLGGNPVKYTLNSDYYKSEDAINSAFINMTKFMKQSNLNDIHSESIADCTLYGQSGLLLYIDTPPFSDDKKPSILAMHVNGYDCLFLASRIWWMPELSIRYVYEETDSVTVEVYDSKYIHTITDGLYISKTEHKLGHNPLIPYYNNIDRLGNMEDSLSKINDIDEQRSNLSSLLTTQGLVLKIFKDVDIDTDTVEKTEQMGYIKLKTNESGQGEVYFEELNIDSDATEKHIEELDRSVYLDAGIVNLDDKKFGNESGEAKKYYLISMEANCVDTEAKHKASDYIMWGIVSAFYSRINVPLVADSIEIEWQRNLPTAVSDEVEAFSTVFGKVPIETAYSLLSFIKDPVSEALAYQEEQKVKPSVEG